MGSLGLLVDLMGLAALVPYFRSTAYPLIHSWTIFPSMGVRPTFVNRVVLTTAVVWFLFYTMNLVLLLTGGELPTWAAIVGFAGLGWTLLIGRLQFRFAPVEPLPAVREAIDIANAHEDAMFEDTANAHEHATHAVAAWRHVIELAPENAGVREHMGRALDLLAARSANQAGALRGLAQREYALAQSIREAHDRLERLSTSGAL
jgi:hypothetical protein